MNWNDPSDKRFKLCYIFLSTFVHFQFVLRLEIFFFSEEWCVWIKESSFDCNVFLKKNTILKIYINNSMIFSNFCFYIFFQEKKSSDSEKSNMDGRNSTPSPTTSSSTSSSLSSKNTSTKGPSINDVFTHFLIFLTPPSTLSPFLINRLVVTLPFGRSPLPPKWVTSFMDGPL